MTNFCGRYGNLDAVLDDEIKIKDEGKEIINLDNLTIESEIGSEYISFDESLKMLRERGYQRHLLPQEILSLLADYKKRYQRDEFRYHPRIRIWTNIAIRRKGSTLEVALNPENLHFQSNKNKYVTNNEEDEIMCSEIQAFSAASLKLGLYNRATHRPEELLTFVYGPNYLELFSKMSIGKAASSQFFLPSNDGRNKWWPCSIRLAPWNFAFGPAYKCASLGIKEKELNIIGGGTCVHNSRPSTPDEPIKR